MNLRKKARVAMSVVIGLICFSGVSQVLDNLNRGTKSRVVFAKNSEIKGTPFIFKKWNKGMIVLNDSVFSKQDNLQFDVFDQKVLVKNERTGAIIEISDRSLTGFSIMEENKVKHDFVRLKNENFTENVDVEFFEIVFNLENKNYLLKKTSKVMFDPNRSKGSQTINNLPLEYQNKVSYYIKNKESKYVKIRLRKKEIKKVLSENSVVMNSFIKKNKISFSKEKDVVKLVNYYYSL